MRRMKTTRWRWLALVTIAVLAAGCTGGGETATTTTTSAARTTTTVAVPALVEVSEGVYEIDWTAVGTPFYGYDDETDPDDPFWQINNNVGADGFQLSLEMFTTGFGEAWAGEEGEFELSCLDSGSGICVHFIPDTTAEGAIDLNFDFSATGTIVINQLDDEGYDLVLRDVAFTSGQTIPGPVALVGGPDS